MRSIEWRFVKLGVGAADLPAGYRGVALDVATSEAPVGVEVFTHHGSSGAGPAPSGSTTSLLLGRIGRLAPWRRDPADLCVFCHVQPDLDCCAASYLAWRALQPARPAGDDLWRDPDLDAFCLALAAMVDEVDQGRLRPGRREEPATYFNLYSLFLFLDVHLARHSFGSAERRAPHLERMRDEMARVLPGCSFNWKRGWDAWMAAGMALLHGLYLALGADACRLMTPVEGAERVLPPLDGIAARVRRVVAGEVPVRERDPLLAPASLSWLAEMLELLEAEVVEWLGHCVEELASRDVLLLDLKLPTEPPSDRFRPVRGAFFYASADFAGAVAKMMRGSPDPEHGEELVVTAAAYSDQPGRVFVSVAPESGYSLKGLALHLHRANLAAGCPPAAPGRYARMSATGQVESDPLFDHADPWYDGRDFGFTLVDAPRKTIHWRLSADDVARALSTDWWRLAAEYETPRYVVWLSGMPVAVVPPAPAGP